MRPQVAMNSSKNKDSGGLKASDPQAARAKTFNIPKDFREELRKLQKVQ